MTDDEIKSWYKTQRKDENWSEIKRDSKIKREARRHRIDDEVRIT